MSEAGQENHQVTIVFIPKAWKAVREIAELKNLSVTDVVNRAAQAYEHLERQKAAGVEILQRYPSGEVFKMEWL